MNLVADIDSRVFILGEYGRGQAELAIVHEANGFIVTADRHDADHRAEAFLGHHAHRMIDIDQYLRCKIRGSLLVKLKQARVYQRGGTRGNRLVDLSLHEFGGACLDQRSEIGVGIVGSSKPVTANQGDDAFDKLVEYRFINIDALDTATGLPRIEHGAIGYGLDRVLHIGVLAHVGRVLAAEFEADPDKAAGRNSLDHFATGYRPGKSDVVDHGRLNHGFGVAVSEV